MENNIRWQQRLSNYSKSLSQLSKFVEKGNKLNELEELGMIHVFENTYELAWNMIKDFYENHGEATLMGSRDAIQLAFMKGLIEDGDMWMRMLTDRKRNSSEYNERTVREVINNIIEKYFEQFIKFKNEFPKA